MCVAGSSLVYRSQCLGTSGPGGAGLHARPGGPAPHLKYFVHDDRFLLLILAVLEDTLDDAAAKRVRAQRHHARKEVVQQRRDAARIHTLNALLDHVVAILQGGATQDLEPEQ